ncbi:hypothetical protein BLNAU_21074 [Blattamonas nauphoetae]|uniref:Secreted protein n=1 Tax=Blattamonas nauphoetae TaxID=2049346 RepID=A0ABQ9WWT1_9EUKA|nr:hypothetical protein BLNAU_21074 [Blattamonas nauphoetae]
MALRHTCLAQNRIAIPLIFFLPICWLLPTPNHSPESYLPTSNCVKDEQSKPSPFHFRPFSLLLHALSPPRQDLLYDGRFSCLLLDNTLFLLLLSISTESWSKLTNCSAELCSSFSTCQLLIRIFPRHPPPHRFAVITLSRRAGCVHQHISAVGPHSCVVLLVPRHSSSF